MIGFLSFSFSSANTVGSFKCYLFIFKFPIETTSFVLFPDLSNLSALDLFPGFWLFDILI